MANFPKPPTLNDDERAVDIYRKAAKIFRSKGFDATSMGDIAEAVDLTKGGLYYYIKGKEALLFAIMSFAMSSLETRVVHPASAVTDPEERLARMIAAHVLLALDEPAPMLVLADEDEGLNAQHRGQMRERKAKYSAAFRESIEGVLQNHPELRRDPKVATEVILSLVGGVVRWFDPAAGIKREEVIRQVQEMGLDAVRGSQGHARAVA